jgi:hypothetical protein
MRDDLPPMTRCEADTQRLPWSRLRRGAVIAFDGALVVGTGAFVGALGTGGATASPPPTPGWAAQTAPLPSGPNAPGSNPDPGMDDESCTSAVFCVAVGDYSSGSDDEGFLDTLTGGTWSSLEAPTPSGSGSTSSEIESVFCPTDGNCVAVGDYEGATQEYPLAESLAGGSWTASTLPLPTDALTSGEFAGGYLKSVDCTGVGSCVASGDYKSNTGYNGFVDTLANGSWTTSAEFAAPTGSYDGYLFMGEVSCSSASSCVAEAGYEVETSTGPPATYAERVELITLAGGTWTAAAAPLPGDTATGTAQSLDLEGISCAPSSCEAVGSYTNLAGGAAPLLEQYAGGAWTASTGGVPSNAASGSSEAAYLDGVSCTADGGCTAVGDFQDASSKYRGLADTITDGVPVASVEPPQPSPSAPEANQDTGLDTVSCLAAQYCTVTGSYYNGTSPDGAGLIDTETNGTWTSQATPVPGDAQGGNTARNESDLVTCTFRGACEIIGTYESTSATSEGSFASYTPSPGYWLVAGDGGVFSLGNAQFHGSQGATKLNQPIVGMAATPGDGGYWLVASDGGIFTEGNAPFEGSQGATKLNKPIVGMAATPDGQGYWLVASDGGIFTHGDAQFYGSLGGTHLNAPIVGMAATPDGKGYWLVASDGGVFTEGDAQFYGSMGGQKLNKPIVGMAANVTGNGYWLVASDGGVFSFGDAQFQGSTGAIKLNKPIVGLLPTFDGGGYWELASDGGIFAQGDAQFSGSEGAIKLNSPVVGGAAT